MYLNFFKETVLRNKLKTVGIISLTILIAVISYISPQLQAYIINIVFIDGSLNDLLFIVGLLLILALGSFVLNYISQVIITKLQYDVVNELKLEFINND